MKAPKDLKISTMTITSWFDHDSRNWITQLLDAEGNQIGDAGIDGHRDSVPYSREALTDKANELAAAQAAQPAHVTTVNPMQATQPGALDGFKVTCTCGYTSTNVFKMNCDLDAAAHVKFMAEKERVDAINKTVTKIRAILEA